MGERGFASSEARVNRAGPSEARMGARRGTSSDERGRSGIDRGRSRARRGRSADERGGFSARGRGAYGGGGLGVALQRG